MSQFNPAVPSRLHVISKRAAHTSIISRGGKRYSALWDCIPPQEWDRLAATFDDVTLDQTAYAPRVRSRGGIYRRLAVYHMDEVVGMCAVRVYRLPMASFGTATIVGGPLWKRHNSEPDPDSLRAVLHFARVKICEEAGLQLVVRPALYEPDDEDGRILQILEQEHFLRASESSLTPLINLSGTVDELRRGLHGKWRNRLVVAERHGMHVTIGMKPEDNDRFVEVYRSTRQRKGYRDPNDPKAFLKFFGRLDESMRPRVALCWKDDHLLSGAVFSCVGETAHYIFGGNTREGLKMHASNLLQWSILQWVKEFGCTRYDLNGVSETDPWFKSGLCGKNGQNVRLLGAFVAPGRPANQSVLRLLARLNLARARSVDGRA